MESGLRHLKKSKFLFIVNNCIYCLMAVALVAFLVSSPHILIIILLLVLLYRLYIKDSTLFMITLIMMLIYFISYQCQVKSITSNDNSDIITCTIDNIPVEGPKSIRFYCKETNNRFLVYYTNINAKQLKLGDVINFKSSSYLVKNNTVPNQFNYRKYLEAEKISFQLSTSEITVLTATNRIDYKLINYLYNYYQVSKFSSYLLSVIIGHKKALDEDFRNNTQILNISHLFVVSGFHVGFLYFVFMFLFKHLHFSKELSRKITLFILVMFLIVNAFAVSILRAILLIFGIEIKNQYRLPIDNTDILSIIACICIIINPFSLQNPGFILSYLITLILFLSRKIIQSNQILVSSFKINFVAQVFSLPIIANFSFSYNFFSIILAPFLNLLYTLVIFPLIILGLLIKSLSNDLALIFVYYEKIISYLSNIDFLLFNVGAFTITRTVIYYYLLVIIFRKLEQRSIAYFKIILLIIITLFYHKLSIIDEVSFIDVGQGDSIFINSNIQGCKALIDTGGSFTQSPGENVANYLKSTQTTQLDYLFITHTDIDHAGDYQYILKHFKVNTVVFNAYDDSELQRQIEKEAILKRINILKVKAYNKVDCGDLSFYIFNPLKKNNTVNDNSLVLFLIFNGDKYLFMGDATSDLINLPNIESIDFLKLSHHGSKYQTSEEFLAKYHFKYAIISVGKNYYNHPAEELLLLLEKNQLIYYRTDTHGTISIKYYLKKRIIRFCQP